MLPSARWEFVTGIITRWWPPLTPDDGVSMEEIKQAELRLGYALPTALREWYLLAGRRKDFIGNEDYLESIEEISIDNDYLVFCSENQGVVTWGIPLSEIGLIDPPVVTIEPNSENFWTTGSTVSEFILLMVALATCQSAQYSGSGKIPEVYKHLIEQHYVRLYATHDDQEILLGDSETLISLSYKFSANEIYMMVAIYNRCAAQRFIDLSDNNLIQIYHQTRMWSHQVDTNCIDIAPGLIIRWPIVDSYNRPAIYPKCHIESKHKRWD